MSCCWVGGRKNTTGWRSKKNLSNCTKEGCLLLHWGRTVSVHEREKNTRFFPLLLRREQETTLPRWEWTIFVFFLIFSLVRNRITLAGSPSCRPPVAAAAPVAAAVVVVPEVHLVAPRPFLRLSPLLLPHPRPPCQNQARNRRSQRPPRPEKKKQREIEIEISSRHSQLCSFFVQQMEGNPCTKAGRGSSYGRAPDSQSQGHWFESE